MKSFADRAGGGPPVAALLSERILAIPDDLLDLLPVGVYVCDPAGLIVRYNRAVAQLWGRSPRLGDPACRFCGACRWYGSTGEATSHHACPMAEALETGHGVRDQPIVVGRPDGSRVVAVANIEPIRDGLGRIAGAVNVLSDATAIPDRRALLPAGGWKTEQLLEALPEAVYTTDPQGRITFYNEAAAALWGTRPEIGRSAFCGSWRLCWPDGTPMPLDECPMAVALRERRAIRGLEAIAERPDGTRIAFLAYPTPLFDDAGNLTGAINMLVDLRQQKANEEGAQRLAAIVESSEDAIVAMDLNGIITNWNRGAARLYGYSAEEVAGRPVTLLIPADRQTEETVMLSRIRRGERVEPYETIRQRQDGTLVDVSLTVSPIRNAAGRIIGASKIARDITERRRAEEKQRLLMREMQHRVKNLFAISSSIVALSAHSTSTPEELAAVVRERLGALARAHALTLPRITEQESTEQATTLHALIRSIVLPYDKRSDREDARFRIGGADVPIAGGLVTNLALLLHEFTTNAAKYGALSVTGGTIAIDCALDGERLVLTWTERGGPPIDRPADSEGFGGLLVRTTVKGQLGGEVTHDWRPDGLAITLSIARDRLGL